MVDPHFLEEANHLILGCEGIDVAVEDLQQVGDHDGLEGSVEGVERLL